MLRDLRRQRYTRVVGSSGTLSTLAAMARELRGEAPAERPQSPLSRPELSTLLKRLCRGRTSAERAGLPGMDPRRADVIVGGALIVDEVFRGAGVRVVSVSDMALREGILVDELQRRAHRMGRRRLQNGRLASVEELAGNFHTDEKHGLQVARLALQIFDATQRLHRMGDAEREYLEVASRLHEAGFFISHAGHHRHSYYLIRNSDLLGFTENEKEIIALTARYHRKGPPRIRHEGFCDLELDERLTVTRLASILRIADGLDRSHRSAVKDIACKLTRGRLVLKLKRARAAQLDLEVWGASRKADLFEEVFGRRVEFAVSGARSR